MGIRRTADRHGVLIQSGMFLRLALKMNKKTNAVSKEELSQAYKTGAVSAIGPVFSTLTIALSLIVMVGSGVTFMRCGVIGAPSYELSMANIRHRLPALSSAPPNSQSPYSRTVI